MRSLALLLLVLLPQTAWAAPFCVEVQGINPECIYVDAAQCRKRAEQLRGICAVNAAEITLKTGTSRYCLADSSRAGLCMYTDRMSCEREASRHGDACFDSQPAGVQPDLYRMDPHRNY